MTQSQTLGDDLCRKLRLVGLPQGLVLPLVNELTLQVSAEGPENVVKRLKVLKQAMVDKLAGNQPKFIWVASRSGAPRGAWRPIWSLLNHSSYRHRKRAFNAMMVYASLSLPKRAAPTLTQERKFLNSVVHSPEDLRIRKEKLDVALSRGTFRKGIILLKQHLMGSGWKPAASYDAIPDIRVYLMTRYGKEKDSVQKRELQIERFLGGHNGQAAHSFPQVKHCLGELGSDYFELTHPWNGAHLDWRSVEPDLEPVGVIGSTQEPGYKFRAFASPNPVVQCAMEGLKQNLLSALKYCEWDCTHDQEKGVAVVQRWLREGLTVHSVDLSDATNNFPLELQTSLLRYMGIMEEDVKLLELVSRSPYRVLWKKDDTVTWDVGQPLGAGPSFMAFALAHAAVALDAEREVGVPRGSTFLVLGDDFITCDDRVHQAYRRRLEFLSCPISESKCVSSNLVGEFAGKVITQANVYHGYKFRDMSNLSFMSVVRSLGAQSISRKFLSDEQYEYCQLVKELPEPWGLGFNPKGRPFADRYKDYLELADLRKEVEPIRTTDAQIMTQWHYTAKSDIWTYFEDAVRPRPSAPVSITTVKDVVWNSVYPGGRPVTVATGDPRPDPLRGWSAFAKEAHAHLALLSEQDKDPASAAVRLRIALEFSRTTETESQVAPALDVTQGQTKRESADEYDSTSVELYPRES